MTRAGARGELTNQLAQAEKDEVARGVRALLGRPLLHEARDPELFAQVRTLLLADAAGHSPSSHAPATRG